MAYSLSHVQIDSILNGVGDAEANRLRDQVMQAVGIVGKHAKLILAHWKRFYNSGLDRLCKSSVCSSA